MKGITNSGSSKKSPSGRLSISSLLSSSSQPSSPMNASASSSNSEYKHHAFQVILQGKTSSDYKCNTDTVLLNSKDMRSLDIKVGSYIAMTYATIAATIAAVDIMDNDSTVCSNTIILRAWPSKIQASGVVIIHACWKPLFAGSTSSVSVKEAVINNISISNMVVVPCKQLSVSLKDVNNVLIGSTCSTGGTSSSYSSHSSLFTNQEFRSYVLHYICGIYASVGMSVLVTWKSCKFNISVNGINSSAARDVYCLIDDTVVLKFDNSSGSSISENFQHESVDTYHLNHPSKHIGSYCGLMTQATELWNILFTNIKLSSSSSSAAVPSSSLSLPSSILMKPPRGVLLSGPRGTGKSSLMLTLARLSGCKMIELHHSIFVKKYVGEAEQELNRFLNQVSEMSPCVLLIDDIDLIFKQRSSSNISELDKRLVSCFLTYIDGISNNSGVFVIATTSNANNIDIALRRPGRLDREIEIGISGSKDRKEVLTQLLIHDSISDADIDVVVSHTHGMVISDLVLVVKEARYHSIHMGIIQNKIKGNSNSSSSSSSSSSSDSSSTDDDIERMFDKLSIHLNNSSTDATGTGTGTGTATDAIEHLLNECSKMPPLVAATLQLSDLLHGSKKVSPSAIKDITIEIPTIRWHQIGGYEQTKQSLIEVVQWPTLYHSLFKQMNVSQPKGVLLYGPPGCSKTLLAKALAAESSMNFIVVKGPELLSKWLGESEKAIQSLFHRARQAAPTIIFFDEIDSLATKRSSNTSSVNNRILSQLLSEMDGINTNTSSQKVIVIAATNRPDALDVALLRPGRIDRKVYIGPPDDTARDAIFRIELHDKVDTNGTASGVDYEELVKRTKGFSGAEIVACCTEACMLSIDNDDDYIRQSWLLIAIDAIKPQITQEMLDYYHSINF